MSIIKKLTANVDLLHGPIFKSLVIFAIPMLISSIFQQLYNTVDIMIVGHCLGDESLAAIGVASPIYEMLIVFAFGVGAGLSIITARCFGQGNMDELKESVASSIVIGLILSISITALAQFFAKPLLVLLKTPANLLDEAYSYVSTITLFVIVSFAYNLCSGLLRSIGNSVMPLIFLVISALLNIVLDYWFIAGLGMGIRGAAIATILSQAVSVILCIIYIIKKTELLIPQARHFRFNKSMYSNMIGQGLSMGFMNCIVSAGTVILQSSINELGDMVIAGHTAARKLFSFTAMPIHMLGMAGNTFISQNRGAGNRERIRKCLIYEYIYYAVVTLVITSLLQIFSPLLVKMISGSSDATVISNGTAYLRYVSPFYIVLGLVIGTRIALQAIGQKILPIISSIIELIGKIVFVMIFIPKFGYMAVIFCEPVIWCFMAVQLMLAFWNNSYIKHKV